MLNVQKYLQTKTLEDLNSEFAIKIAEHPDGLPLVILNYNQIESNPKTHPIIRECLVCKQWFYIIFVLFF